MTKTSSYTLFLVALHLIGVAAADVELPFTDPTPGVKEDADLTFYRPGEPPLDAPGACGIVNTIDDPIVAIAHGYFDAVGRQTDTIKNPNNNPLCNLKIEITTPFGKEIATITDRCHDCEREDSVDVTPKLGAALFGQTDFEQKGRLTEGVSWRFVGDDTDEEASTTEPEVDEPIVTDPVLTETGLQPEATEAQATNEEAEVDSADATVQPVATGLAGGLPRRRQDVTMVKRRRLRFL